MPLQRCIRRLLAASGLALLSLACSDKSPAGPDTLGKVALDTLPEAAPAELVVSDPYLGSAPFAAATQAVSARSTLVAAAGGDVAYVSLPSRTLPEAISVTIRNLTTGASFSPPIPIVEGGFDPVPIVAGSGDELELRITRASGGFTLHRVVVPKRRPPRVVRTSPPKGMIDVALNSRVTVVFTEPIAPATLTTATVYLLQGSASVSGTLSPVMGSLVAVDFVPDVELASGTTYRLVVTRGVRDADGDSLEAEVATDFTTTMTVTTDSTTTVSTALVFSSIGTAPNHACGIEAKTGLAYCWGDNHAGALGAGEEPWFSDTPLLVSGARRFNSISVGSYATCAIEAQTSLAYCWGYNSNGELGDGTWTVRWVPTLVGSGRIRLSSISAGGDITCGIEALTRLAYCWGGVQQQPVPTLVGNGSLRVISISASDDHACGIEDQTGLAYCWGANDYGELGDGTTTGRHVPTLVNNGRLRFSSIDAGYRVTCGIEAQSGLVYCWGNNNFGQVGDGTTSNRSVPTLVGGSGRRFTSVDVADVTCGIEAQTSVGYCWGHNNLGQVGDGTTTNRLVPTLVGDGNSLFSSISTSGYRTCGVESQTGLGYCWGYAVLVPTLFPPRTSQVLGRR